MECNRSICGVCVKQFANYTCPRCNMRYCSVPCYKSHSFRCTESFMRDNVLSQLENTRVSPQTKRKMLETLKRNHEQDLSSASSCAFPIKSVCDSGDEDEEEDDQADDDDGHEGISVISEATLWKLSEGKDVTVDDLSTEERKAFLRAVKSGRISHLIKPWDPWWLSAAAKKLSLSKQGTGLVQALGTNPGEFPDVDIGFPDIPPPPEKPLDPLEKLASIQPSPLLSVHMVDIIYSYCFTLRLFNGDWRSDPVDAAVVTVSVSRVLGQASSPVSITEALLCCLEAVCSPSFKDAGGYDLGLILCEDLRTLFGTGKAVVICALADLKRIFESAASSLKSHKRRSNFEVCKYQETRTMLNDTSERRTAIHSETRKSEANVTKSATSGKDKAHLKSLVKKLNFFLSWANESNNELFQNLAELVEKDRIRLVESRSNENFVAQGETSKKNWKMNPSIEEM